MSKVLISTVASLMMCQSAFAGFAAWSSEKEEDPFSKGAAVTVDYMSSIRSGIFIFCNSSEHGLKIRAVPGFAYDTVLDDFSPKVEIAIDGDIVASGDGSVGSVGDNIAASQVTLDQYSSRVFIEAFARAKRQVAIKDGISDKPYLLNARGTSKSGAALRSCLQAQQ